MIALTVFGGEVTFGNFSLRNFSTLILVQILSSTAGPRLVKSHILLSSVTVGGEASYLSKLTGIITGFIFRLLLKKSSIDGMVECTELIYIFF
jgi:hypothetical protein